MMTSWYISCVYQMQQKVQAIRCFDAIILLDIGKVIIIY